MIDRAKSGRDIPDDCVVEDTIRGNLVKLVDSCFVDPPAEEATVARKHGAKSSKVVAKSMATEERIQDAAAPMEAKRFLLTIAADSNKNNENASDVLDGAGNKRKYDTLESEREIRADDSQVLWRVNFEEFLHRFRHKACAENVRERQDGGTQHYAKCDA